MLHVLNMTQMDSKIASWITKSQEGIFDMTTLSLTRQQLHLQVTELRYRWQCVTIWDDVWQNDYLI